MARKIGRNDRCYCGSGFKYKNCCMEIDKRIIDNEPKVEVIFDNRTGEIAHFKLLFNGEEPMFC